MNTFFFVVSFLVFFWAVVGFIKPAAARLPNRWVAFLVWIVSVILLGLGTPD